MRTASVLLLAVLLAACGSTSPRYAEPSYGDYGGAQLSEVVVTGGDRASATPPVAADRKLVRTASLRLSTPDEDEIPQILAEADAAVAQLEGFAAVVTERSRSYRIPADQLDEALARLEGAGSDRVRVENREVRVEDVTARYTDLEADLENQRALLVRLREIAAQATTVTELLEAERELARVTARIDQLERQLRPLEDRVRLATVSLAVHERVQPGPVGWVLLKVTSAVSWLFVRG
jgi:chromosome segregation ATPase